MDKPANPDRRQKQRRSASAEAALGDLDEASRPAIRGGAATEIPASSWGTFQDHLDDAVGALGDGEHLEVRSRTAPWRIRIQAGWPGVEGPGSLAYHLQLGSHLDGKFGPWATSPYARSLGFAATRVAGAVAALGVVSDATGLSNPSMISSGAIGGLEMADLTVELLREAFGVRSVDAVQVVQSPTGASHPEWQPTEIGAVEQWWSNLDFHPAPEVDEDGDHVVGWIGNVMVELSRDTGSLPGLVVTVARARLTDPAAEPLPGPGAGVAGLLGSLRLTGTDGVSVEPVTDRNQLVHAWAHHMVVTTADGVAHSGTDDSGTDHSGTDHSAIHDGTAEGTIHDGTAEGTDGTATAAADAAAQVISFVRAARSANPDVSRPSRMIIRLGD